MPTLPAILSETAKAEPVVYTPEKPNYGNASASAWTGSSHQHSIDPPAPVGTIIHTADGYVIRGDVRWMLCDGTPQSISENPELFDAIGYRYGAVGGRFRVPDRTAPVMPYMSPEDVRRRYGLQN